ncbi:MAG: serine/threonine protein kinase [Desulfobulbaceae bacterium]|nr:serine/threonine protein kinase [Desulfobulbaceae bacterium]
MGTTKKTTQNPFQQLSPDQVISLAEQELGEPFSNLCRPMNSYINRVYELESRAKKGFIAKFYRPGRWSATALADEHQFLRELADHEVPVIAPLLLKNGTTLGCFAGVHFALFPKKGGRFTNEFSEEQWLALGRLLGRTHAIGALVKPGDRPTIHPAHSTRQHLDFLQQGKFVAPELAESFFQITSELLAEIVPLFANHETLRIHGDCHASNLIYRPGESFYLIDFDDFASGPAVQDLWLLLPDLPEKSLYEIDLFLEGYETFRSFDRRTLALIEPLRAMRFIHYQAWCAHQAKDLKGPPTPDWGSPQYWRQELADLGDQLQRIRETRDFGNW